MHEIHRFTGPTARREVVATAPSLADAIELARSSWEILELEQDALYPTCADFITTAGEVYAIQPAGFAL